MDLTDIFRTFHPETAEFTFFLSAHGTFSRIDPYWDTNQPSTSTKRSRSYMFSDHSARKLKINHDKQFGKTMNIWR